MVQKEISLEYLISQDVQETGLKKKDFTVTLSKISQMIYFIRNAFVVKLKYHLLLAHEFSRLNERITSFFTSTPVATVERSYSFNPLYTMIKKHFFSGNIEHTQYFTADNEKFFSIKCPRSFTSEQFH